MSVETEPETVDAEPVPPLTWHLQYDGMAIALEIRRLRGDVIYYGTLILFVLLIIARRLKHGRP